MSKNPFTPTFGIVPSHLAGRKHILSEMRNAFENGLGDPNLSTILIGARGSGKTALLSCIANEAQECGWISVDVVAGEGMLEDIFQRCAEAAAHLIKPDTKRYVTGISVGQLFGIEWNQKAPESVNWRTKMNALFEELKQHNTGLLITIDEVKVTYPEMIYLASMYQLFIREGKLVSLVMAGIPSNVSDLLQNADVSFLRRSQQRYLGRISDVDIEAAFQQTINDGHKNIETNALHECVKAIQGFPYMMQLVGFRTWEASGNESVITAEHAACGIDRAQRELTDGVLTTTWQELSTGDRKFLMAMLQDEGPCRVSDIASRLGKGTNYVSTYKKRLLQQGLIEELPNSTVEIGMPFFRDYLEQLQD